MKFIIQRLKNIWKWGAYIPTNNVPDNVDVGFSFTGTKKPQLSNSDIAYKYEHRPQAQIIRKKTVDEEVKELLKDE